MACDFEHPLRGAFAAEEDEPAAASEEDDALDAADEALDAEEANDELEDDELEDEEVDDGLVYGGGGGEGDDSRAPRPRFRRPLRGSLYFAVLAFCSKAAISLRCNGDSDSFFSSLARGGEIVFSPDFAFSVCERERTRRDADDEDDVDEDDAVLEEDEELEAAETAGSFASAALEKADEKFGSEGDERDFCGCFGFGADDGREEDDFGEDRGEKVSGTVSSSWNGENTGGADDEATAAALPKF